MPEYASVEAALDGLLAGRERPPTPRTLADVQRDFTNPQLARAITGVAPSGPLPGKGTSHRREYDATMRRLQRAQAAPGRQQRRLTQAFLRLIQAAAPRAASALRSRVVGRAGIFARIRARIRVSRVWRVHTMPAEPGQTHIAGEDLTDVIANYAAGRREEAAGGFLRAFFTAYWGNAEPAEIGEIIWVQADTRRL
jgi:hypothetical protein